MALANGIALLAGALLGRRLPRRLIARVSGAVFIVFGLLALASAPFR
ncbi:MAG: TMEM165/GDT1 family protein [Coriobacteriia bacterium]|nr:TMEM165/GDT1 family protein [Coriobacteriia bacterium]